VRRTTLGGGEEIAKIMDGPRILALREILEKVVVADPVRDFAVRLVLATHPQAAEAGETVRRFVKWGASPRAVPALVRAARAPAPRGSGRAPMAARTWRSRTSAISRPKCSATVCC